MDRTDRCTDVDQRTLPVDEQDNQRDQKGQRCGYPGLDASSWWRSEPSAAGGYDGRDDADDALRLNRQVQELEPRALRPIPVPMLR